MRKPTLIANIVYNATQDITLEFEYTGNEQILKNRVVIERLSDSVEVYNREVQSFLYRHIVPKNTLKNGVKYRIKIQVGSSEHLSEFSDFKIITALDDPIISFETIPDPVQSQSIRIAGVYVHPNDEVLKSYQFKLHDNNGHLIKSYEKKLSQVKRMFQDIDGLLNDNFYQVSILVETTNGQVFESSKKQFRVQYYNSNVNTAIELKNICNEGAVQISILAKQSRLILEGKTGGAITEGIIFEDNEKIDLKNKYGKIKIPEEVFEKDDFIFQIWFDAFEEYENARVVPFITFESSGAWMNVYFYSNRYHLIMRNKHGNRLESHFATDEDVVQAGRPVTLYIKFENGNIDFLAEGV